MNPGLLHIYVQCQDYFVGNCTKQLSKSQSKPFRCAVIHLEPRVTAHFCAVLARIPFVLHIAAAASPRPLCKIPAPEPSFYTFCAKSGFFAGDIAHGAGARARGAPAAVQNPGAGAVILHILCKIRIFSRRYRTRGQSQSPRRPGLSNEAKEQKRKRATG